MDRINRLAAFWNWLPAFRAVAETEHLPTASNAIHITPSALSRTIRLLEEDVGTPLFVRKGRGIELTPSGRLFLRTVRDAMRIVHDGLVAVEGSGIRGPVHVSAPGPFAPLFVIPAATAVHEQYPELEAHLHSISSSDVNYALRRGLVDVALLDDPIPDSQLEIHPLAEIRHDVFVASGQPAGSPGDLEFVAPVPDESGGTPDAWPLHRPRNIALRVTHMEVAIDAVRTGRYAAALPVLIGEARGLQPLGVADELETSTLYLMHRPLLVEGGAIQTVIEAIRSRI